MCGRYTLRRINLARFNANPEEGFFEEFTERPRFNIAPSQLAPIIRLDKNDLPIASAVRWGLIPHWAKEMPKTQPINARAETVESSGMFRQAFARRRCLVVADGFYEWRVVAGSVGAAGAGAGKGKTACVKQPHFIHYEDDREFAFAGLWERWRAPKSSEADEDPPPLDSFTIITTTASADLKFLHERMPVIVKPEDYARWLDRGTPMTEISALLLPLAEGSLRTYPVSTIVNSPKNDSAANVEAVSAAVD